MKILYSNGTEEREEVVDNLYHDVAKLLASEPLGSPLTVTVKEKEHPENRLAYKVSQRSGTRFIIELENSMPDGALSEDINPVFLTCVKPESNAYKFYRLDPCGNQVKATYGRMGVAKGQLFGERSFMYPISMFWPKYYEKLSKGYVDRSELYLDKEKLKRPLKVKKAKTDLEAGASQELFQSLMKLARRAVEKAKVQVPITPAILKRTEELINLLRVADSVESFNSHLLELIAVLQRPVRTGDGSGVREIMAQSEKDFIRIIQREDDLFKAMEGSAAGNGSNDIPADSFGQHDIEVYEVTERQRAEVLRQLNDNLKPKVRKIYRVIPRKQKKRLNQYLRDHNIRTVKQFWHGSRNQNWMSIILNSLKLNPDAITTGDMYGKGIYFAPSSMKSWNYTSYRGTSWAKGSEDIAYMGLYATAYGTPKDVDTWDSSEDYIKLVKDAGADCLHAHKGYLKNDEIVFYDENAVLLNYIVEFR